jgi:hypothetical protein
MNFILFAASNSGTVLDQIREIAVPIALFISIVMQKLEAIRAKRVADAAELARETLAKKLEEQTEASATVARIVEQKLNTQNEEAIRAAKEVKDSLSKAAVRQEIKMEEIHVDVNSKMGTQKKKTWEFALALAQRPGADSTDQANARAAERDYLEHMEAQARADERVKMVREQAMELNTTK